MNNNEVKILVVDDDIQMQVAIKACLARMNYLVDIVSNGKLALEAMKETNYSLVISDQKMPEMTGTELQQELKNQGSTIPFIMITAYGTINQAVEAMQLGAADFITKPFSFDDLQRVVERVLNNTADEKQKAPHKKSKKGRAIITNDALMIKTIEIAEAVAKSDATVLIQGESGTGKELIARLIHTSSTRAERPFVAVNCAALPENLLESELFGHEKGSFTGAQGKKLGKFELAHGGTILLDEISEMDIGLQAKLLRVLQEREIDRVGGSAPISIDVRVLATTNRNLADAVRAGTFREDLYYRLNVIPLMLPPLRERLGDVKLLVDHFMQKNLGSGSYKIPAQVLQTLESYPWPGNVRELQNAVERAAILSRGEIVKPQDFLLSSSVKTLSQKIEIEKVSESENMIIEDKKNDFVIRSGVTVQEMEKKLIMETLKSTNNNRTQAALLLGISIRTLRNKLAEYRQTGDIVPE